MNQSKILNTFWLKIMNGTMGKFHKRDTKSSFLYQKEVSFISIYRRVSWDIWVKRSVDRGEVKTKKNNNCLSQWQLFPQRNFRSKMYTFAFLAFLSEKSFSFFNNYKSHGQEYHIWNPWAPHCTTRDQGVACICQGFLKKENSKLLKRCGQTILFVFELDFEMVCFETIKK